MDTILAKWTDLRTWTNFSQRTICVVWDVRLVLCGMLARFAWNAALVLCGMLARFLWAMFAGFYVECLCGLTLETWTG